MTAQICIDWISMTFKNGGSNEKQFLSLYSPRSQTRSATPRNGYTTASVSTDGVLCMWHSNFPEMGLHVVFDGSTLRNIFTRCGVSAQKILQEAAYAGASITRLDLAADAENEGIDMVSVWKAIERGEVVGTARKFSQMNGLRGGHTIYVGSRTSERFIRLYDKGAEMGIPNADWKRLELETKGMMARAATDALQRGETLSSVFNAFVTSSIDLPKSKHWQRFLSDKDEAMDMVKMQKTTDTERWIETQVIAAVIRHYSENKNSPAIERLRQALNFLDGTGNTTE